MRQLTTKRLFSALMLVAVMPSNLTKTPRKNDQLNKAVVVVSAVIVVVVAIEIISEKFQLTGTKYLQL